MISSRGKILTARITASVRMRLGSSMGFVFVGLEAAIISRATAPRAGDNSSLDNEVVRPEAPFVARSNPYHRAEATQPGAL